MSEKEVPQVSLPQGPQGPQENRYDFFTSVSVVLQGIEIAQQKGAYTLENATKLYNASLVLKAFAQQWQNKMNAKPKEI